MSWKIRNILINSDAIRSNIYDVGDTFVNPYVHDAITLSDFESAENSYVMGFDNPEYEDLLFVEMKLKELIDKNMITELELKVINQMIVGNSYTSAGDNLGITRGLVKDVFYRVCTKIAYYIGGEFTDEGYIEYMVNRYNLNSEQIQIMIDYMKG